MSMRFKRLLVIGLAMTAAAFSGCSSSDSGAANSGGQDMNELAALLEKPEPVAPPAADETAATDQAAMEQPPTESPASDDRQVAGRAPIGEGGYFVAIGGARRQILNRVEDLAWTQAVQHFKATEGRLPRDHEEFMTKVIQPLEIDLGYKEEDQEFLYDPNEGDFGTVFVVAKEPAPAQ